MATRMVTLRLDARSATLDAVCKRYGLGPTDVDSSFGVISVDPRKNLYTILVDESVAERLTGSPGVVGSFSNPVIEPFGPPEKATRAGTGPARRARRR